MANITLQGNEIHTSGNLPELGTVAQDFTLVAEDLSEKTLSDFAGKKVVLNIFPVLIQEFALLLLENLMKKLLL